MIRILIKMAPLGFSKHPRAKVLGQADIWNTGEGTENTGYYKYRLSKVGGFKKSKSGRSRILKSSIWKEGRLPEGMNRKSRGVWDLLYLCLKHALGNRN